MASGTVGMARFLYDTDVLIDHLEGRRAVPAGEDSAYSVVTRAELYSGTADEDTIDAFLEPFDEIVLDRDIANQAGRLRRLRAIKLPGALIAATALLTNRTVVTRNARDFKKVQGLKVLVPKK